MAIMIYFFGKGNILERLPLWKGFQVSQAYQRSVSCQKSIQEQPVKLSKKYSPARKNFTQ